MKIVLLFVVLLTCSYSHKLNIFLSQEGNKVYASAYFAGGNFCKNCELIVKNEKDEIIQNGKTDKKGEFIITNLAPKISVEVKTLEGHGAKNQLIIEKVEQKEEKSLNEINELKNEIKRLKSENELLKEKVEQNEVIKMIFALLVIAGVFFILKRIKK